jgi:choline kinase
MTEVAVLLCAGGGNRLRPLTDDRPKALVDVGGETILERAVRLLLSVGVRELVVATGYRHEAVEAAFSQCAAKVTYCHSPDFAKTQNSVSLRRCAGAVGGRPFFKLDGDVLFHPDVLARLGRDDAPLSVAVERRTHLGDEEMKVIVEGVAIRSFGKRLDPARCAGESIGVEKLTGQAGDALFRALVAASDRTDLYYEDVYTELIAGGLQARMVDVTDLPWIEIDTPDDLVRARRSVEKGELDRVRNG